MAPRKTTLPDVITGSIPRRPGHYARRTTTRRTEHRSKAVMRPRKPSNTWIYPRAPDRFWQNMDAFEREANSAPSATDPERDLRKSVRDLIVRASWSIEPSRSELRPAPLHGEEAAG